MHDDLAAIRTEYAGAGFGSADAGDDPMALFAAWFEHAREQESIVEPNAMSLATTADDGTPSARMVLLKSLDARHAAFDWYTNLESRKAREARATGYAALCWWWPGDPGRQVRAVGRVVDVPRVEAIAYFEQRPVGARVSAVVSRQSRAIESRAVLQDRAASIDPAMVDLPPRWGGQRMIADEIEFWQGRAARLHDRITFLRLDGDGRIRSRVGADAAGGDDAARAAGTIVTDRNGTDWLRVRLEP